MCRIAGTLHQLQHAGHTKYISWSLTFTCSTVSTDTLRDHAVSMEKELSDTLDLINKHRHHFHALNYFTTQQLLQIRRQFGNLKQNKAADVTPQLLSLLKSFSLQITASSITNIVEEICSEQEAINRNGENEVGEVQSFSISEDGATENANGETQEENQMTGDKIVEKELKSLSELIQELTEEQEEIFVQLHDLGYSKIVCYKAVQHAFSSAECTSDDDTLDAAMEWCFDNANQYGQNDDTTSDTNNKSDAVSDNEGTTSDQHGPSEAEETMPKESISISHPVVQELLELGFTPELSLKGATLCNGNFEQASEWCLNAETESSEIEQPLFASFDNSVSMLSSEDAAEPIR